MDRRLRQFLAVAETGNVSRAAEALHVSQPTVSVSIRKLEQEHGVALFKRSSRGVELTEFGSILFDHARAMDRLDNHARAEIRSIRSKKQHGLSIGCGFAWWIFPLHDVVAGFRRDNPELSIHVDASNSLDGIRKLLSGDISLFMGTEAKHLKAELGVEFLPLFHAQHAVFAREHHPLAGRTCSWAEIAKFERLDVVPVQASHLGLIHPGGSPAGVDSHTSFRPTLSCNSMVVCIDLLANSNATLGYPRMLEDFFARQGIRPLALETGDFPEPIGLYHVSERSRETHFDDIKARIAAALEHGNGPNTVLASD